MTQEKETGNELRLSLELDAPREKIWRCWTESELLKQWFCPRPWTTAHVEVDLRPGGAFNFTMRSPEGEEMPNFGVCLEIIRLEKLVFTDAYSAGWIPSEKPFMTGFVELSDNDSGGTHYVARARHWSDEDLRRHEQMGFYEGWKQAALQLEAVAQQL
jgi:uncharacterized protein YndB with AHSA1/START domain